MLKGLAKRSRPGRQWRFFYRAFNAHEFSSAADFTTDDWQHIHPGGGWKRGRNEVLVELKAVHGSFLKGATDAAESMAVASAGPGVAVVTVTSKMSAFTMPNDVAHRNDRQIRTFVVVKRASRWPILLDQNTTVIRTP